MKTIFFHASILLSLLALPTSIAWGACRVITPTGSGNNSGSDWSNACQGLSGNCSASNMVRGDTYYLAKGTYSSQTLSKAASGSLLITIKSPTTGEHCSDTGFNQANHVGQAVFNGPTIVDSDYWVIDGQYGTEYAKGSYGIKFKWTSGNSVDALYCRNGCGNSTFRYIEIQGSNYANSYCDEGMLVNGYNHPNSPTSNILVDHAYSYQSGNNFKINSAKNVTIQNSLLDENYSNANCHGENIASNDSSLTVRHNTIKDCVGTACMATPCAYCGTSQFEIYGNVLLKTQTGPCIANGGGAGSPDCLSSILRNLGNTITSLKIYNNTFVGFAAGLMSSGSTTSVWVNSSGTTSNSDFKNNLFYNNGPIDLGNGGTCASNSYYSTARRSSACTGDQTEGAGNPFVNATSDFRLTADTAAWSALSAPYNVDGAGTTRTSSRGAFQRAGSGSPPNPPTNLSAIVN